MSRPKGINVGKPLASGPWAVPGVAERFLELYNQKKPTLSYGEIAPKLSKEFSVWITRNSISGRVDRLGLDKRGTSGFKGVNAERRRQRSARRPRSSPPKIRTEHILPRRPIKPAPVQYTKFELRRMLTAAMLNTGGVLV